MVSGPGQKGLCQPLRLRHCCRPPCPTYPWKQCGKSGGYPADGALAAKIALTAAPSSAFAARPYTVSVGMTTRPPARQMPAAFSVASGRRGKKLCFHRAPSSPAAFSFSAPVCRGQRIYHFVRAPSKMASSLYGVRPMRWSVTALRVIISADALGTVTRAHLAFRCAASCASCSACFCAKSLLRSTFRALSFFYTGCVHPWHSTTMPVGRCVTRMAEDVLLMCCPPAPEERNVSIFKSAGVQLKLHFLRLRHHGHRDGGRMHPPLGFCLGHALHAVHTAFKLHAAVGSRTVNGKAHFLHAAQLGDIGAQQLGFPSARLCVHVVHAVQTSMGEQRRLFTARAAARIFHNDVFFVIFILRQQQKPNLFTPAVPDAVWSRYIPAGPFLSIPAQAPSSTALWPPQKCAGPAHRHHMLAQAASGFIFFH